MPGTTAAGGRAGAEPVVSRILFSVDRRRVIPLGRRSPAASSGLPGSGAGHAIAPLFGLAPCGVCRAIPVARDAGGLLPHRFTLARTGASPRRPLAVCSLLHFPSGHPAWALPSALPCGVRTFLRGPAETGPRRPSPRLRSRRTHSSADRPPTPGAGRRRHPPRDSRGRRPTRRAAATVAPGGGYNLPHGRRTPAAEPS